MKKHIKENLITQIYIILFSLILSISFSFVGFSIGFIKNFSLLEGLDYGLKTFILSFSISFIGLAIIIAIDIYSNKWMRRK